MKTPEERLIRGKGNFINCTDYDDAIEAIKEYAIEYHEQQVNNLNSNCVVDSLDNTCNHSDNDPEAYINGSCYDGEFIGLYCEKCDTLHSVSI